MVDVPATSPGALRMTIFFTQRGSRSIGWKTEPSRSQIQPREVADTVRSARHETQKARARHEAACGEVLGLPPGDLLDPVGQLSGPFRGAGRAAGLEDLGQRRRRTVSPRDEIFDGHVPQLVHEVGEALQVLEGVDIGHRVERQSLAACSQNAEPVSSPKCHAIAACRYARGSSTGASRGTSNSEKSNSGTDRSCRTGDDAGNLATRTFPGCSPR